MNKYHKLIFVFSLLFLQLTVFAQKKVACIGDSVTKGYGLRKGQSYPEQLQQLLGNAFTVGNFGFNGATLLAKGHKPYVKTQEFTDALAFQPDILVVSLGLNDTDPRNWPNYKADFLKDYSQLIAEFRAVNPAVEVYICRLSPIFSGHSRFLSGTRDWFAQIQAIIPQIAANNNATLIDNFTPLTARIDLFADFLHPDEAGAAIIAKQVHQAIIPVKQPLSIAETLGSHMVLQREVSNPLSGKAAAGMSITLNFKNKNYTTTASNTGNWTIDLPPVSAGGPYELSFSTANQAEVITLNNVLFGDVFLASGQSNMVYPVRDALRAETLIAQASAQSNLRLFKNKTLVETNNSSWDSLTLAKVNSLAYFEGQWEMPNPTNCAAFSAIALSTAYQLAIKEKIPIGIIELAVGGSNTESWIPRQALEADNLLASYIHNWRTADFIQDFCRERANTNLAASDNKNQRHPYAPAYNFEAGVSKWVNTQIKAVLWYQGESNAHNLELHAHLLNSLISSWRTAFKQPLPFYFVQLSSINRPSWPSFRDQQRQLAGSIPNCYMAISSDLGDPQDVHPKEKILVGERLANLVLQHSFNKQLAADSPQPLSFKLTQQKLIITFANCRTLGSPNGEAILGFQLVDSQGQLIDVKDIKITKNRVEILLPQAAITAVQYAYSPYTQANLQNESAVPVSTFTMNLKK